MKHDARIAGVCALGLVVSLGALAWAGGDERVPPATAGTGIVVLGSDAGPAQRVEVPAEILVLHATNSGGGIDPELQHLRQLRKPPFSAYDTYRLERRYAITLVQKVSNDTELPNRRVLRTVLKAVLPEDRFQVAASISHPKRKDKDKDKDKDGGYLPLLEVTAKRGEPFFVAGQSYRGGILVVGIQVGKAPPPPPKKK